MTDDRQLAGSGQPPVDGGRGVGDDPDGGSEASESQPPEVVDVVEVVEPPEVDPSGSEVSVAIHHREGPLPSPADLRAYFDISEYVGRSIVEMARDVARQRHRMERRSFWVMLAVILCITAVMLAVVWGAVRVATEVSVVGGVIVLLASPAAHKATASASGPGALGGGASATGGTQPAKAR